MRPAQSGGMDETPIPTPRGCRVSLRCAGEVWSWRLTTAEGADVRGLAPDPAAARRSAAFAAFAVTALARVGRRRF
jgi:hypothetical protein